MRLAIFIPSFGDGGVERMLVNLAGGLARRGVELDFLTRSRDEPYLDRLDPARHLRLAAGPHQALHRPAGVAERFGRRKAEPSGGPQNQDVFVHAEVREVRGIMRDFESRSGPVMQPLLLMLVRLI